MSESTGIDRREWLGLFGAAGVAGLLTKVPGASAAPVSAVSAVDHLLLGIGDLEAGIAWVERATGVKAAFGGIHPGVGTRNALLALGGKRYLEIIGPDPAQKAYNFHLDLRELSEPRLITWAAATSDIGSFAKEAAASGYEIFGPREGSRTRPDGKVLSWKTAGVLRKLGTETVEPMPFFIEWAPGSPHPSQDSPQGCELVALGIEHPEPAGAIQALKALGIAVDVKRGERARLTAELRTRKGRVTLT